MVDAKGGKGAGVPSRPLVFLVVLALFLSSCYQFVPYRRPPPRSPLALREKIYKDQRVRLEPVEGVPLDMNIGFPQDGGPRPVHTLFDYYGASGDPGAVALLKQAQPSAWEALALCLGGVVSYIAAEANQNGAPSRPYFLAGIAAGFGGELTLIAWGTGAYELPAADHFNAFLKRDLGLNGDASVDASSEGEAAGNSPFTQWYGFLDVGLDWISNYDLTNEYMNPGASAAYNSWPRYGDYDPQVGLGAGFVRPGGATLELRFDAVDRGEHGLWYYAGTAAQTPYAVMDMNAYDLGLVPGYTFTLARFSHGQRLELFAGCQLGLGLLSVQGLQGQSDGVIVGRDQLGGTTFEGGPLFRIQVPSSRHTRLGLELGYRYEKFTDMAVSDASGTYAGQVSPAETLRGSPAALDFSGPFVDLNLQFGRFPWSH